MEGGREKGRGKGEWEEVHVEGREEMEEDTGLFSFPVSSSISSHSPTHTHTPPPPPPITPSSILSSSSNTFSHTHTLVHQNIALSLIYLKVQLTSQQLTSMAEGEMTNSQNRKLHMASLWERPINRLIVCFKQPIRISFSHLGPTSSPQMLMSACKHHLRRGVAVDFSESWSGMRDMGVRGIVLTVCEGETRTC